MISKCLKLFLFSFMTLQSNSLLSAVIDAPILLRGETRNIVSERQQAAVMQRWIEWKTDELLPRLMEKHGVRYWLLRRAREAAYTMLLEANYDGMVTRFPEILVMQRTDNDSVVRREYDGSNELAADMRRWKPAEIAASNEARRFLENVAESGTADEIRDSEMLEVEFLQQQPAEAISIYEHVARVAYEVYAEAFSNRAVVADVTTTDDLNWWIRDRYRDLGLGTYDHPTVTVQRAESARSKYGEPDGAFQIKDPPRNGYNVVLRRGDLIFADTGINYFGLNTDTQQCAYILKSGEVEMPPGLQQAIKNGRRLQDLVVAEIQPDKTGTEVYRRAMERADAEQLRAEVYAHPLSNYFRRYQLNGGFIALDRFSAGPDIGREGIGDIPSGKFLMGRNSVYALELDVEYAVPEWGNQDIRMMMETNIAVTDSDVIFLGGRQESCYLIH